MLSILIPAYNYDILNLVKKLHKQGIESYKDFEIIVMEDGSTKYLNENWNKKHFDTISQKLCWEEEQKHLIEVIYK